jgi:hypothetical protein
MLHKGNEAAHQQSPLDMLHRLMVMTFTTSSPSVLSSNYNTTPQNNHHTPDHA